MQTNSPRTKHLPHQGRAQTDGHIRGLEAGAAARAVIDPCMVQTPDTPGLPSAAASRGFLIRSDFHSIIICSFVLPRDENVSRLFAVCVAGAVSFGQARSRAFRAFPRPAHQRPSRPSPLFNVQRTIRASQCLKSFSVSTRLSKAASGNKKDFRIPGDPFDQRTAPAT